MSVKDLRKLRREEYIKKTALFMANKYNFETPDKFREFLEHHKKFIDEKLPQEDTKGPFLYNVKSFFVSLRKCINPFDRSERHSLEQYYQNHKKSIETNKSKELDIIKSVRESRLQIGDYIEHSIQQLKHAVETHQKITREEINPRIRFEPAKSRNI